MQKGKLTRTCDYIKGNNIVLEMTLITFVSRMKSVTLWYKLHLNLAPDILITD